MNSDIKSQPQLSPNPNHLELHIGEILASRNRFWLRGRVVREMLSNNEPGWFSRWWGGRNAGRKPKTGKLEVRIGRHVLRNDVTLSPEGEFDLSQHIHLPPARRGWRAARCRLEFDNEVAEGGGVFLSPAKYVKEAVLVTLPVEWTASEHGLDQMTTSDLAMRLGIYLQRLRRQVGTPRTFYYLAAAPRLAENRQEELALAITALDWPGGTTVVLPMVGMNGVEPLSLGIDRLRWLFADILDVSIINLESDFVGLLQDLPREEEDRSRIHRVIHYPDEYVDLCDELGSKTTATIPPQLRPSRSHRVTRYPIVFCHGMLVISALRMSLPENLNSFIALEPFLKERGFHALFPEVSPTSGVEERAAELREQILRWTDEPVNIIAHSMGGLDSRHMITKLGMANRVKSLTTIATPHHGSYMANWFLENYHQRVPVLRAMEAIGVNIDGFRSCRPEICEVFNLDTPDMPEVQYFSYSGEVPQWRICPILRRFWNILTPIEGPNDGMVSVTSAHWGTHLGTTPADHFAQTPDTFLTHPAETFDALEFYLRAADDLAWKGF